MNAIQLLKPNHQPSGVWACECNRVYANQDGAEKCCKCSYCGEKTEPYAFSHPECREKDYEAIEAERLEKAEKLEDWDGWVYLEGLGYNEGYFESLEQLIETAADEECELPEFVFVCNAKPFPGLDIDNELENATDGMYEDAYHDLEGTKELRAAVKAFNEKNASLMSYSTDYKRAVRVPKPEENKVAEVQLETT